MLEDQPIKSDNDQLNLQADQTETSYDFDTYKNELLKVNHKSNFTIFHTCGGEVGGSDASFVMSYLDEGQIESLICTQEGVFYFYYPGGIDESTRRNIKGFRRLIDSDQEIERFNSTVRKNLTHRGDECQFNFDSYPNTNVRSGNLKRLDPFNPEDGVFIETFIINLKTAASIKARMTALEGASF